MKTNLNRTIVSVKDAKAFLTELHNNREEFHPEDSTADIEWNSIPKAEWPTEEECVQLDSLMDQIYALNVNKDIRNLGFDPCLFLLELNGHVIEK